MKPTVRDKKALAQAQKAQKAYTKELKKVGPEKKLQGSIKKWQNRLKKSKKQLVDIRAQLKPARKALLRVQTERTRRFGAEYRDRLPKSFLKGLEKREMKVAGLRSQIAQRTQSVKKLEEKIIPTLQKKIKALKEAKYRRDEQRRLARIKASMQRRQALGQDKKEDPYSWDLRRKSRIAVIGSKK